jgi:hypothetical protein
MLRASLQDTLKEKMGVDPEVRHVVPAFEEAE